MNEYDKTAEVTTESILQTPLLPIQSIRFKRLMDVKRKCKDLRAFDRSSIVVAVDRVRTPPGAQLFWGITGLQYLSKKGSKWPKKVP